MNNRKITIICVIATILIALFGGISVFAFTVNHPVEKNSPRKDIKNTAIVDNITDNSIELTINKNKDSDSTEKITLTFNDKDEVDDIKVGDEVRIKYNKNNELISIKKIDETNDNKDEEKITARIEKIEGNQITVTEGKIDNNSFTPEGESKVLTLEDQDEVKEIKVGDIVKLEVKDNKITDIDQIDIKKDKPSQKQEIPSNNGKTTNSNTNYSTDV